MTDVDVTSDVTPVVGIGASAGGLNALSELLRHLPVDTGMAFVVVQHLSPGQESLLGDLLARTTRMPVMTVTDGQAVAANQVYVIPPKVQMTIAQGRLHLEMGDPHQLRGRTIDRFFESLAIDQKAKAIAIVLSGSNDDGARGVRAIRAEGGIVFAQKLESAEFAEMPAAAIATEQVDFVLCPTAIAAELVKLKSHPYLRTASLPDLEIATLTPLPEDELTTVFRLLQRQTKVDFANYKSTTFQRRLRRRMALQKCLTLGVYIQHLYEHPGEVQALYQDVLITVTSFFRDPDVFAALQEKVFPHLLEQPTAPANIRLWVPGCATGEEVYSLAICLLESIQTRLMNPTIQIFGTDINEEAIEIARTGLYRENQLENVSADRRYRFFNEVDGGYQIKKGLRELCIFARQDLSSDPPFSEIDLLSCRNVLIYFKPTLQKRVLSVFHYSLKSTGFLVLGNSESLGETTELFEPLNTPAKIYTKRSVPSRLTFDFVSSYYPREVSLDQRRGLSVAMNRSNLQQWADQIILSRFGPSGVIVNEQLDILQFRGDTSPYLRIPAGEPSYQLLKMIRPSLLIDLRVTIEEAQQLGIAIRRSGIQIQDLSGFAEATLIIEVIPFHTSAALERYYLVLFDRELTEAPPATVESLDPGTGEEGDPEIRRLRQELANLRQELLDTQTLLQLTVEEKESTNQQLIAANEEILSSNEELKSTNEELQTAKEEIQSANEELKTTNEELHHRNIEFCQANDDLLNLISNVNIPILMLSEDLCIHRFTPSAQSVFNLIPSDVGRPIGDLRFGILNVDLETLVSEVLTTLNPVEREIQDQQGHWFMLRIRPYRTVENRIMGAIVALVDIHNLKQSEQQLQQVQRELQLELDTMKRVQDLGLQWFTSLDLELVLNQLLDTAIQLLNGEMGNIQLYDASQGILRIVAHRGFDGAFLDYFREVSGGGSTCGRALRSGQRVMVEDVEIDPEFMPHRAVMAAAGVRAVQSTPIMDRQGQLLGVMSIHFRQPHRPSERELWMLDLYMPMVSTMISLALAQCDRQVLQNQAQIAEAANLSKDEFLAMLSHELRTPLASISTWAQLMAQGKLDRGQMQEAITSIRESARIQTKLIEDLLDVSRIVQQRFEIAPEPCDLWALLHQAIAQMSPQIAQKELQLETDIPPCSIPLLLDRTRMLQVFTNLLNNAIKFTPEGGAIAVRLRELPTQTQIEIADTGVGIAPQQLPHIFERFRQADSSITRQSGGLGLGLFLVHWIMERHGGTVMVESVGEGRGCTFTLTLPKGKTALAIPLEKPPPPCPSSLAGVHVVLIEDDLPTIMVMTLALEEVGIIVNAVRSADEARKQIAQALPDLIVSDIGLPDVNGYELIRQIRGLPREQGGQIPAIALSGYADQRSITMALEAGFQLHLSKPVDLDALVASIADLVQRSGK